MAEGTALTLLEEVNPTPSFGAAAVPGSAALMFVVSTLLPTMAVSR